MPTAQTQEEEALAGTMVYCLMMACQDLSPHELNALDAVLTLAKNKNLVRVLKRAVHEFQTALQECGAEPSKSVIN